MEDALKDTLEEMRGLSMRIVEVEDAERRHISRELHDRIGGNVAALQISLGMVAERLARGEATAAAGLLGGVQELVTATSSEVRTLMTELRPAALDDFGLAAPLRTYASALAERVGLNLTFSAPDPLPRAKPAVETAFFRIAQEALTNIAKHARARNVHIELSESDGVLCLCVHDDGVGFGDNIRAGGGLRSMKERADAVGATLKVTSSPSEGTRVIVEAKL